MYWTQNLYKCDGMITKIPCGFFLSSSLLFSYFFLHAPKCRFNVFYIWINAQSCLSISSYFVYLCWLHNYVFLLLESNILLFVFEFSSTNYFHSRNVKILDNQFSQRLLASGVPKKKTMDYSHGYLSIRENSRPPCINISVIF